ncbi:MAG: hypothetical protein ACKO24_19545 [Leptolyngbyaceae cyanobacterium]
MLLNTLFADNQFTSLQTLEVQAPSPLANPTLPPASSLMDSGSQRIIVYGVFLLLLAVLVVIGIWSKKFEVALILAGFLALILIFLIFLI